MKRLHSFTWSVLALVAVVIFVPIREGQAATPTEGVIAGQVRDQDTGQPVAGVTVVASGPEGDVAALTDGKGGYQLRALPIGHYTVRFHRNEVLAEREATVSVDKVVRVNMRLPAVPAQVEVVSSPYAPPAIDVGSSRIGATFTSEFIDNIPNRGADVASLVEKTPGAYNDSIEISTGVSVPGLSLAGGTGADNAYYLEGMNVTALRDGLLGTNLRVAFLEEAEVMSSGYGAEYGRALGGVVNMALKSGTNAWKGSAFSWVEPGWMAGSQKRNLSRATVLSGVTEPDYNTQIGAEVGGPIIKNKLFIWVGYAPEISRSHFVQYTDRFSANPDGSLASNPDGSPIVTNLFTRVIPGESTTHNYAGKLTWRLRPEHVLSLSLVGIRKDEEFMRGANMDLLAGMTHEQTNRQDIIAHWQSALNDRKWRIDASLGLHTESYSRHSPFGDAESFNDVNWMNSPSLAQFEPRLAPYCPDDPATGFQSCPVQGYQSGGYGIMREISAYRLAGQIKSTNIFEGLGLHELKYGLDYEVVEYDDKRWNSGTDGSRGSVWVYPTGGPANESAPSVLSLYRLPYGMSSGAAGDPAVLASSPYYQDSIHAKTHAYNSALFIQESYQPLSNLTINAGLRWETQRLTDYAGQTILSIGDSIAPRVGVVYDPSKEGRSKVFAHYGQYYESIPMDLANRAFGGEGVVGTDYNPPCDPTTLRGCTSAGSYPISGDRLTVQKSIKGSYNNEVVLGGQYQRLRDLVLGVSVIYRWLGRVVEDTGGSIYPPPGGQPGGSTMLANPTDPKPERTYKAIQLTANKLLARHWFFTGSYTYSRTMGNYAGLYSADSKQLDPNYTSQYDVVELMKNRNGPLPNDRPHVVHLDGYYQFVLGRHLFVPGLSFSGRSGVPITPLGRAPIMGENETFILPRGSAGRTPFVTQLDGHLSYRTKLSDQFSGEAFIDIFNIFNQKAVLTEDAEYTVNRVMPAASGTSLSQVPVVDGNGKAICAAPDANGDCPRDANGNALSTVAASKNPNYLRPTSYQLPISGRLGLRIWF
jgi:Carboxypeptidase regulatory-like domain